MMENANNFLNKNGSKLKTRNKYREGRNNNKKIRD